MRCPEIDDLISNEDDYCERDFDDSDMCYGDPRRCPTHGTITSSADGMFDGVCGACEAAMDAMEEPDAHTLEEMDPEHAQVTACAPIVGRRMGAPIYADMLDDDIPF